jgi:hypothetical protein
VFDSVVFGASNAGRTLSDDEMDVLVRNFPIETAHIPRPKIAL